MRLRLCASLLRRLLGHLACPGSPQNQCAPGALSRQRRSRARAGPMGSPHGATASSEPRALGSVARRRTLLPIAHTAPATGAHRTGGPTQQARSAPSQVRGGTAARRRCEPTAPEPVPGLRLLRCPWTARGAKWKTEPACHTMRTTRSSATRWVARRRVPLRRDPQTCFSGALRRPFSVWSGRTRQTLAPFLVSCVASFSGRCGRRSSDGTAGP